MSKRLTELTVEATAQDGTKHRYVLRPAVASMTVEHEAFESSDGRGFVERHPTGVVDIRLEATGYLVEVP